jgi:hypothetical protein
VSKSEAILGNDFDRVKLLARLRDVIASVDGVSEILTVTAEESERHVSVSFEVRCQFDDTVDDLAEARTAGTAEVTV